MKPSMPSGVGELFDDEPPVTWLLPVHNAQPFLEAALASIAKQSYRNHSILAWDDGSTDDSLAILKQWIPERIPGRVLGHARLGLGPALARLVEHSPTELLARMDSDDIAHPDRLAKQVAYMQTHPDVAVVGTQMRRMRDDGQSFGAITHHPADDPELRWALRLVNPINHPTVMMRRSAVLQAGNYHDLAPGQDDDLWVRVAKGHRMANLPEVLLDYREHASSITAHHQTRATEQFRARREQCLKTLFPMVPPSKASRLVHLLTHPDDLSVTRSDLSLHRRAARCAALNSGLPVSAFVQTDLFRQQSLNLRTRWLKRQPVVRAVWPKRQQALPLDGRAA